jgi:hypothetical protein
MVSREDEALCIFGLRIVGDSVNGVYNPKGRSLRVVLKWLVSASWCERVYVGHRVVWRITELGRQKLANEEARAHND